MICRLWRTLCFLGFLSTPILQITSAGAQADTPHRVPPVIAFSQSFPLGASTLQVDFAEGPLDLPRDQIVQRIKTAAHAVTIYYGRFPVSRARILIVPVAGRHGVLQGTTWGDRDGFPAFLRLRIGESTTSQELGADWIITHELVHTALPSLPDDQHWLEEGLASYIEPVARVQAGELTASAIWADMRRGMPNGEPAPDDRGLNNTHTWGRTYWGGALFCLMADIKIRQQTANRFGLQDALRAVVAAGGSIDKEWPLSRILNIGDQATGTHVLQEMYTQWGETPVPVDLSALWQQLGVQSGSGPVQLNAATPLASIREAITNPNKLAGIKQPKPREK
jgi:hypothetical protein